MKNKFFLLAMISTFVFSSCNQSDSSDSILPSAGDDNSTATFKVSGTLSGLGSTPIKIVLNGSSETTLAADGSFSFENVKANTSYAVTVSLQPTDMYYCQVTNGSGTITANVSNVAINCTGPKRLVVSTSTTSGNLGASPAAAITYADSTLCNLGGGKTYKALIGITGVRDLSNDWPLKPNVFYVRSDDTTKIGFTTSSSVFTFPLDNAISSVAAAVYTGLDTDFVVGSNCSNFSSTSGAGNNGYAQDTSSGSMLGNGFGCHTVLRVLCVEQ